MVCRCIAKRMYVTINLGKHNKHWRIHFMYFVNTFVVCVKHYSWKFPEFSFSLCFGACILSQANTHPHTSAHPSIMIGLWFYEVLHVTAHHTKFFHSELCWAHVHSCNYSDAVQMPWNPAAKVRTHPSVALSGVLPACTTDLCPMQATNIVEAWQQGYSRSTFYRNCSI